ncbi:MAG: NAD(P)/FAD-dependent oxidoreductase [Euryarchaeota archaeon]|nr:NAD(P)/FAD-dependent oxidoreductase [Euryarchaeota archaeon]
MDKLSILGAGPAGLSAAINLAKANYEVNIFEKNRSVGGRFNGDFQGLENWSENIDTLKKMKNMNIDNNFESYPFSKLTISNGTQKWDFLCNKPAFYLVKRGSVDGSLDQGLKEQALNLGIDIHFGETIPENQVDIIATGPDPAEIFAAAKGIVFKTNMENVAIGLVNDNAAVKGYSYLLVANGHGCMCTVSFDRFKNLNKCFYETKNLFSSLIDLDIQKPHNTGGIGSFSRRTIYNKEKMLYVGEAAGFQDILWGFGIKTAITSGFLAARSIIDNEDYRKKVKDCFDKKFKASIVNRFLWEKFGIKNYSFIVDRIHNAKDPLKYLNSFHNYNILQKLIYPFALRYMQKRYDNIRL